jgi:hypothetical protein
MGHPALGRWLECPDPTWWAGWGSRADRITWQLQQQTRGLPSTIQSLETRLDWVKDKVNRRKFVFRNQKRTNLMLGLLLLHSNNQDDERAYARELRLHLVAKDGVAPPRHLITDPIGLPSLWGH